jgi:hypothetical protein
MKYILHLSLFLSVVLTACGQKYNNPDSLEFGYFEIGDTVDTNLFKKYEDLYFPNYLDGWTMENVSKLPSKYEGLPIAIWTLKSDSSVALTLLDNRVLNITKSYITTDEKEIISNSMIEKFGGQPKKKNYEESHPLQAWITYWELETWKTKDVIVQIGNSDMRKPNHPKPKEIRWNLVYSNFKLENEIIKEYKEK